MVPGRDRPKEKVYVIRLATQADAAAVNMLSRAAGLIDGEKRSAGCRQREFGVGMWGGPPERTSR